MRPRGTPAPARDACPDCGLVFPRPRGTVDTKAPRVCEACLRAATPEPPEGWPIEARWINGLRGRGVFAKRAIETGETVERCWVLGFSPEESAASVSLPTLNRYTFPWIGGTRALVTGAGLLYNFDLLEVTRKNPNLECALRPGLSAIEFRALRTIAAGEELTWNYRGAVVHPR